MGCKKDSPENFAVTSSGYRLIRIVALKRRREAAPGYFQAALYDDFVSSYASRSAGLQDLGSGKHCRSHCGRQSGMIMLSLAYMPVVPA